MTLTTVINCALMLLVAMNAAVIMDILLPQTDILAMVSMKYYTVYYFITLLDIDECLNDDDNNCSENGNCTNTEGGYNCTCNIGYAGDGFNCSSMFVLCIIYDVVICI